MLHGRLPSISVIVPMKNEEKFVSRFVNAFLKLNYPPEKLEMIIVEDGSVDRTVEMCAEYSKRSPGQIRLMSRSVSGGKPSALNYGLKHVRGELVAVFDADSVPEPTVLLKAAKYFEEPSVVAVQGRTRSINENQSLLAQLVSCEESIAFETYLRGKDALGLFVPITGSCYFVRKSAVEEVGGWDDDSLAEDAEMSIELALKDHRVKYAPDVQSWQESSAKVSQLVRQRTRWFRGCMELALEYGKLATRLDKKNVDIEFTLAGSFMFPLCLFGLAIGLYGSLVPIKPDPVSEVIVLVKSSLTVVLLLVTGTSLVYAMGKRKKTDVLRLPLIYAYWIVEAFIATYAFSQIILRRPRKWTRTEKTGAIAS
jgi:cellulose synthase/poly-beta-1,6-N-acetylglucosamine synthase-like glycosyltransferase